MEETMPAVIKPYLPMVVGIAKAILIFVAGWIVSKIAAKFVVNSSKRANLDEALSRFFGNLARYTVLVAVVVAALGAVGIQTTSLVAVMASAGLAIGLALQGSLGHFASGVMILFFRPFGLGDVITAGGQTGKVDDIGLFATTLITPNNEKIVVPNGKIMGDSIVNMTTLGIRRGGVDVGVAYGADVETVRAALLRAAKNVELSLDDPAPAIAFAGLGASSLDFTVYAWAKAPDWFAMLGALRKSIYEELNRAKIEIPFNQIVVHQASAEPATVASRPQVASPTARA